MMIGIGMDCIWNTPSYKYEEWYEDTDFEIVGSIYKKKIYVKIFNQLLNGFNNWILLQKYSIIYI